MPLRCSLPSCWNDFKTNETYTWGQISADFVLVKIFTLCWMLDHCCCFWFNGSWSSLEGYACRDVMSSKILNQLKNSYPFDPYQNLGLWLRIPVVDISTMAFDRAACHHLPCSINVITSHAIVSFLDITLGWNFGLLDLD